MSTYLDFKKWLNSNVNHIEFNKEELSLIESAYDFLKSEETIEIDNINFNKIFSKEKARFLGITYTPKEIRIELIDKSIRKITDFKKINDIKFCDPCCGSGTFAIDVAKKLESMGLPLYQSINEIIHFYDIDKTSILLSLANIYLWMIREGVDTNDIYPRTGCMDFFQSHEKYDLFITNPPYIKLQNIENEKRLYLKENFKDVFSGSLGTSPLFLYKMKEQLSKSGVIGVITQNNFFTSNSGEKIRRNIKKNIFMIESFGSDLVFQGISAYTCLIFLSKEENTHINYIKNHKESIISMDNIDDKKWRFGCDNEINFIKTSESNGQRLDEICDISVGIATLKDKAYKTFKKNGYWYSLSPSNEIIEIESEIVKPLIKVSDFPDEKSLLENDKGIIYPYDIIDGRAILIDENNFIKNYPNAYFALSLWKKELKERSSYKKTNHPWYQWGRNQSMIPNKCKLITKTFNNGPNFMLDETSSLISNGYSLKIKKNNISVKLLQKILNSSVFEKYAKLTSYEIDGNYQCYQKNFIERFCIPNEIIDMQSKLLCLEKDKFNDFISQYY